MLLYVHVPFCRVRCSYCAFYSLPLDTATEQKAVPCYVDLVRQEAESWSATGERAVRSLFFGGGTPSLLNTDRIADILTTLRQSFPLDPDAEITLEANPESFVRPGFAAQAAALGINRVSLGAQSLDRSTLRMLGRVHDAFQVGEAVRLARRAGFASVGLDLIWGLPGQDLAQWLTTLDAAIALEPDHISAYGLSLEPGTALDQTCRRDKLRLPDEGSLAAMYLEGGERLEKAGYGQYEISNYARPGHACRHNQATWQGEDYLGFGPSAVSTLDGVRLANPADFASWAAQVRTGQRGEAEPLSPATRCVEKAMLALRTVLGLDLAAWERQAGQAGLAVLDRDLLAALGREGYLLHADGRLRLTRKGMLVSDALLERILPLD